MWKGSEVKRPPKGCRCTPGQAAREQAIGGAGKGAARLARGRPTPSGP